MMPMTMPSAYRQIIARPRFCGKKAAANTAYIGIFAEQLIYGVRRMVIFLSRSEETVRVAMMAGTEQPKPMSIGTKLRPERPSFLKGLSITKATRAI